MNCFIQISVIVSLSLCSISGSPKPKPEKLLWSSGSNIGYTSESSFEYYGTSAPSTGYFSPKSDLSIDIESEISLDIQKKNACVKNIFTMFNQNHEIEKQVEHAIKHLTNDIIQTTHGQGYYSLLHGYLLADKIDEPKTYCGRHIFSSRDVYSCIRKVEIFGTSSEEALYRAYFNYTKSKLYDPESGIHNHRHDYMDYISNSVSFNGEPPNPFVYCFDMFDYTTDKQSDYFNFRI